jgi:ferritin-like metal-binding protein YciE
MADLTARDAKLVQYLNEAYGKEKQLETTLRIHARMATRAAYRKRLQQHLEETQEHARLLRSRIRELGGKPETISAPAPQLFTETAARLQEAAQRGAAIAQGPLHALRGTGEAERLLKNAKSEYADEAQEIATYTAIEALAEEVGDAQTAQLARGIRRQEQRMASFLEKLISTLTRAVAQAEIPSSQRDGGPRRRRARRPAAPAGSLKAPDLSSTAARRRRTASTRRTGSGRGAPAPRSRPRAPTQGQMPETLVGSRPQTTT